MEEILNVIFYILSAVLGVSVGSFLNVCIYRLPRGNFFSEARSFCPKCGEPIKAYDNIPLLSYVILRGRCRHCHERISPRYPIIEALNMIFWIVNYAVFGMHPIVIIYDILASTMIVIAMIDYDTTEIPDSSIITIIILALLTFIPIFDMDWKSKLIGAFCVSVPMLIIAFFGGMGFGDVKLYFALGLLFGWELILVVFLISMIVGAIVGVINMLYRKSKSIDEKEIPPANMENTTPNTEFSTNSDMPNSDEKTINIDTNSLDSDAQMLGKVEDATTITTASDMATDSDAVNEAIATYNASEECPDGLSQDASNPSSQGDMQKYQTTAYVGSINGNGKSEDEKIDEYERDLEEKIDTGRAIPFGPFIVLGAFVAMYAGKAIIELYKGLLGI